MIEGQLVKPHLGTARERMVRFLNAYEVLPADVDLTIGHGVANNIGFVVVELPPKDTHGFSVQEARFLADLMEHSIHEHPGDPLRLADICMHIRHAATLAEKHLTPKETDHAHDPRADA